MTAFELWPPPVPPERHSHQDLFKARISSGLSSLPATSPTPPHEKVSSLFPLLSGYRPESNLWRTPSSPLIFLLLDFTTWPLGMLSLCLPTLHTHSPLLYLVPCKWIESYSSPLYSSSFPSRPTHHPSPLCSLLQQVELSGPMASHYAQPTGGPSRRQEGGRWVRLQHLSPGLLSCSHFRGNGSSVQCPSFCPWGSLLVSSESAPSLFQP